ncbi:unnamed protein product, partial [Discosporangium mesarthrocarpum]
QRGVRGYKVAPAPDGCKGSSMGPLPAPGMDQMNGGEGTPRGRGRVHPTINSHIGSPTCMNSDVLREHPEATSFDLSTSPPLSEKDLPKIDSVTITMFPPLPSEPPRMVRPSSDTGEETFSAPIPQEQGPSAKENDGSSGAAAGKGSATLRAQEEHGNQAAIPQDSGGPPLTKNPPGQ